MPPDGSESARPTDAEVPDAEQTVGDPDRAPTRSLSSLVARLAGDRTVLAVLAITLAGLALRTVFLGYRVLQWDEGRVAYWALRFQETGVWEYRPIVHGPFLVHVDAAVFSVLGASDFTLRLVVAVVGALLPAAAWLFREHLRDAEVVALALVLATNPMLLYYSRFYRNDVVVAAFMVLALGLFVRTADTGRYRYLWAGAAAAALGFTAKENALLYVLCWLGAGALVLDGRVARADAAGDRTRLDALRDAVATGDRPGGSVRDRLRAVHATLRSSVARLDYVGVAALLVLNPFVLAAVGILDSLLFASAGLGLVAAATVVGLDDRFPALGRLVTVVCGSFVVGFTVTTALFAAGLTPVGVGGRVVATGYVVAWLLGAAALLDVALFGGPEAGTRRPLRAPASIRRTLGYDYWTPRLHTPPVVVALVVFLAVATFFYAPRSASPDRLGLWHAVGVWRPVFGGAWQPWTAPAVVSEALVGSWSKFARTWVAGGHQGHEYLPYFRDYVRRLGATSLVTCTFAVVGFLHDRYGPGEPRELVAFATFWGGASLLGYPLVTDIQAPWATVHTIVPLAVPAAVGVVLAVDWLRARWRDERFVEATLATLLAVAMIAGTAGVAFDGVYAAPDERRNEAFAHWTQPDSQLKYTLGTVERVSRENEGVDVLFYGSTAPGNPDNVLFHVENEADNDLAPPGQNWHSRLPLPWYLERYGASVDSVPPDALPREALADAPPVVIAYSWDAERVRPHLQGYTAYRHGFKLWSEDIVVFVDESALPDDGSSTRASTSDRETIRDHLGARAVAG